MMMNVIDRFQLEKELTEKSAEAEAQARQIAEERKKVQKLNQQLQEVNVGNHSKLRNHKVLIIISHCSVREGRAGSRGRGNS